MTVGQVYATRADLVAYAPATVTVPADPEATRLLTRASTEIRRATRGTVYDIDVDGYPTATTVRDAFEAATCAQALWWVEHPEDERGASSTDYDSVSIGSVTLGKKKSASGGASIGSTGSRLAPTAAAELADANLPTVIVTAGFGGCW